MRLVFVLLFLVVGSETIFRCDFESNCYDFVIDQSWGLTDGHHPILIDYDHTLNNSDGHFIFYQPSIDPSVRFSEIKTKDWLQPSLNQTICFSMWYFTRNTTLSLTIQFIQGDDQQLSRVLQEISLRNQSIFDWTEVKVVLPVERLKLAVRLNITNADLVLDDLSIDFCDLPAPPPVHVLLACDFESSCGENFLSLPFFPYQWQVIQAGQPPEMGGFPPNYDYTYFNRSGHYAWLNNMRRSRPGRVGYYSTQQAFNIQLNQSYCLNFFYFLYGDTNTSRLEVFLSSVNSSNSIQRLWPLGNAANYSYPYNRWTWGLINLPLGHYSILFRVQTFPIFSSSFVLDNIAIVSCDYPPSSFPSDRSFLSFSCDFDDQSLCGIQNQIPSSSSPSYNFSVYTGDTVPKPQLGPTRDHTNNSTAGGFLYWNQQLPFLPMATGFLDLSKTIEQNSGMCFQFAFYVSSSLTNQNATTIILATSDPSLFASQLLWNQSLDDSYGWQLVTFAFPEKLLQRNFFFTVQQRVLADVSVAFDDIAVEQCGSLPFVTTTIATSTSTWTSTESPTTTTAVTSVMTSVSAIIETTATTITMTSETSTSTMTSPS